MNALTAGSEIDSWCTKCRMDLGHRIIAMLEGRPKRVICQTCGSQHNYRAPQSERTRVVKKTGSTAPRKGSVAQRVTEKAKAEAERVNSWEKRIAGQAVDAFTRYSIDKIYSPGELVTHKKFGEGFVAEVLDGGKVSIMFRDGARMLAHGQSA
ncbi:MAG: hypothetical protein IPI67_41190 [Myxococcales bacterium]|nr:hypothetical protein [Myxococcales bacterium]